MDTDRWKSLIQKRIKKKEQQQQQKKKTEEHVRDLWDNIKHQYLHHRGSRGEEGENIPEKIFEEIITKNLPNMGKGALKWRKHREFYMK